MKTMISNPPRILAFAVAAVLLSTPAERAHQQFPDQQNLPALTLSLSIILSPLGQEFVPRISIVDWVELMLANTDASAPYSAVVQLRVRQDTILGPILGTSGPINLPFGTARVVRFDFPRSVHLSPHRTCVIEIVPFPGGGNVAARGGLSEGYAVGRVIVSGKPYPASDKSTLWFREGTWERVSR